MYIYINAYVYIYKYVSVNGALPSVIDGHQPLASRRPNGATVVSFIPDLCRRQRWGFLTPKTGITWLNTDESICFCVYNINRSM